MHFLSLDSNLFFTRVHIYKEMYTSCYFASLLNYPKDILDLIFPTIRLYT
jgi:hypothetical protein